MIRPMTVDEFMKVCPFKVDRKLVERCFDQAEILTKAIVKRSKKREGDGR